LVALVQVCIPAQEERAETHFLLEAVAVRDLRGRLLPLAEVEAGQEVQLRQLQLLVEQVVTDSLEVEAEALSAVMLDAYLLEVTEAVA
jgi:hypothetical protein